MIYLVLGLALFLGVHSISIVAPAWRDRTAARLGNAWRGLYSLITIAGVIVMVWGYGIARRNPVRHRPGLITSRPFSCSLCLHCFWPPIFRVALKALSSIQCCSASCSGQWHISSGPACLPTSCYLAASLRGQLQTAFPSGGVRSGRFPWRHR